MYFPAPYAVLIANLLTKQYSTSFGTFPECKLGWEIITSTSPAICMDPAPKDVKIYQNPDKCGNTPPQVCWEDYTVSNEYDITFACSDAHDALYQNISLYQHKCRPQ